MFIHAADSLPSYQAALVQPATIMTADAGDMRQITGTDVNRSSDWRTAQVPGVDGLCFVRRGSGEWNGVVTVCEGKVSTLGSMQRPMLEPALLRGTAVSYSPISAGSAASAPSASGTPIWQLIASGLLLFFGIGLALKSGSMMMEGLRKYG